jgi:hypothetical protein
MKKVLIITTLALGVSALSIMAQDAGGPPKRARAQGQQEGPGGDGQRPVPPLIAALDANHDGVIDEQEIANAPAALKTLDKNGDGKLTADEIHPPRPEGQGQGARRGGQQGGQRGGGPGGAAGGRPPGPPPGDEPKE